MATVKVKKIVGAVEELLHDDGTRYERLVTQDYINDAYRLFVTLHPKINSKLDTYECTEGVNQVLTSTAACANALGILDVRRNIASGSDGLPVRRIDREIMDEFIPGWPQESTSIDIEHWMFDEEHPLKFSVYPPAKTTARLEVSFYEVPTTHSISEANLAPDGAGTTVISVSDKYKTPLVHYCVFRHLMKDAAAQNNEGRALFHLNQVSSFFGEKISVEQAISNDHNS